MADGGPEKGSTAFEKEGDGIEKDGDGFEFVQTTMKTRESIVRRGLRLALKRRLWGLLGGHLKQIKQQGLAG